MDFTRPTKLLTVVAVAIFSLSFLSGCAPEPPIAMPAPQITRFVLDLSGSNDALDQFEKMKPSIYQELKNSSLGNPFDSDPVGPIDLSITYIMASASQAKVKNIVSSDLGYSLYKDLTEVYQRSSLQIKNDWPLVLAAEQKAFSLGISTTPISCIDSIFEIMAKNLGVATGKNIAEILCKKVINTLNVIERDITSSLSIASGSDVFGALREIDSWVEKIRDTNKNSKIKIVFASDMVHWTNGQRDLFGNKGLLTGKIGKDEVCQVANSQAQLSGLNLDNVDVDIIGRGNSAPDAKDRITADEGEALAIFWKCFAEASGFNLNTLTDGRI